MSSAPTPIAQYHALSSQSFSLTSAQQILLKLKDATTRLGDAQARLRASEPEIKALMESIRNDIYLTNNLLPYQPHAASLLLKRVLKERVRGRFPKRYAQSAAKFGPALRPSSQASSGGAV